jgi:hypothetical protein
MRILCAMLICFTVIKFLVREEEAKQTKKLIKLIYEEGYLINAAKRSFSLSKS